MIVQFGATALSLVGYGATRLYIPTFTSLKLKPGCGIWKGACLLSCTISRKPPGASKPNSLIEILTVLEIFPIMCKVVCALISQIPKISGCDMLTVYQGKSKSLRTEILHQRRKDLNARFEKWYGCSRTMWAFLWLTSYENYFSMHPVSASFASSLNGSWLWRVGLEWMANLRSTWWNLSQLFCSEESWKQS